MYIDKKCLVNLKDVEPNDLTTRKFKMIKEKDLQVWEKAGLYLDKSLLQKILPILIETDYNINLANIKLSRSNNSLSFDLRSMKNTSHVNVKNFYLNNGQSTMITITTGTLSRSYKYAIIDGKLNLIPAHFTYALGNNSFTKVLDCGGESFIITHGDETIDVDMVKNDHNMVIPEEELRDMALTSLSGLNMHDVFSLLDHDGMLLYNYDNICIRRTKKSQHGDRSLKEKLLIQEKELKALRLMVDGLSVDIRNNAGEYVLSYRNINEPMEIPFASSKVNEDKMFKKITRTLKK